MPISVPEFQQLFPYQLDEFQQQAINALDANQSVVVSAPTGSGKTMVGEYAIYRALQHGQRVFYTTPLKALSNQKLRDFQHMFGDQAVGLLTGDLSVNRSAPILVMTTEIFRNILYGTLTDVVNTSLEGVTSVILDECHYMNDRQRGTVWEESIIYCPADIQLIALSATVANAQQLVDWMSWVHGPTQLIESDWRPVPLAYFFANAKGLFPLLNQKHTALNPRLKAQAKKHHGHRHQRRADSPDVIAVLQHLREREMLPAIYFIFSRKGCDRTVESTAHLNLLTPAESAQMQIQIETFRQQHPDVGRPQQFAAIAHGIAAHHAGLLPQWKTWVEELFQAGLIKVVFATETLAAGINMPARTTVIASLSKRTDLGHRLLTASEVLQMAGRAGRRGMDTQGYVITVQTPFEGAKEAAYLATIGPDPLVSQFTPSYGMVLNLLQTRTLDESKRLIDQSFGQYIASVQLSPQKQAIADLQQELTLLLQKLGTIDEGALKSYQKLQQRLKEELRLLKILDQQAQETLASELTLILDHIESGAILSFTPPKSKTPIAGVFVANIPSPGHFPYLVCLSQNNHWFVIARGDVMHLDGQLNRPTQAQQLTVPPSLTKKGQTQQGDATSLQVAEQVPDSTWQPAPEVMHQQQRLQAVESQMQQHPAHASRQDHSKFARWQRRVTTLERQLHDRETKFNRQFQHQWQAFMALVEILQKFRGLEDLRPTELGQITAAFRGENELWLGLACQSQALNTLDPHILAAVCAALVVDNTRPDVWLKFRPSATVQQAVKPLRPIRRQLIQTQHRYEAPFPVCLDTDLVGLVEQWALGISWSDLCDATSLDAGDLVRILRRTVDLLSQIPYVPYLSEELKKNARRAEQPMNRFPISDTSLLPDAAIEEDLAKDLLPEDSVPEPSELSN
ncbi:DEAD/DEAH box helicase [Acaryochloris marina]|uniref:DEAD/DEAH box-like helicase n=1 Tax=Acaryochloris marina (strain MBIC 11017) TaxID=329726 RepID=B0CAG8_ACAM1|nr:DEAD/DEAH box helicase [Acaryochloris marina]ABW29034.1 DEAD/DEAH box-like helicase [Acaryochloris marina MBIC11017]BDM77996.1 DEAD/DEAH box helicase [Acaryochloris marina MBIC10699]